MTAKTFKDHLRSMHACPEALAWVHSRSPRKAWEECENPYWLEWYLQNVRSALVVKVMAIVDRHAWPYDFRKPTWKTDACQEIRRAVKLDERFK